MMPGAGTYKPLQTTAACVQEDTSVEDLLAPQGRTVADVIDLPGVHEHASVPLTMAAQ